MTARTIFLHLRRRSRTIYTQLRLAGRMLRGTPNPYLEQPTSEAPEFDWSKKFEGKYFSEFHTSLCLPHLIVL